jgi:hypothetical protein
MKIYFWEFLKLEKADVWGPPVSVSVARCHAPIG